MPLAYEAAVAGAPDGAVVLAEEQTAGQGRRGRGWSAPHGTAILCSILFRPPLAPDRLFTLTAAVSLGLCRGIARETGLRPAIKWPNDLLLDGRKLAGVLTAARYRGAALDHAVVGFGVNVNMAADQLPPSRPGGLPATSLAVALGRMLDCERLLNTLLEEIDRAYDAVWSGRLDELHAAWLEHLAGVGEWARVETEAGSLQGVVAGVAPDGALLLRTDHGLERVVVGEVTLGPRQAPAR
jgi:BirA family transcriptional regulator, biotin operon repressor / biotin---[acetyl-CoA-carboxylase] ligase